MALVDLTLILDCIIALAIIALPVEAGILVLINSIKRQLTSPARRAELIHEAAAQFWEPFQQPAQRAALIGEVADRVWQPLRNPEFRQKLVTEASHGIMRAVSERTGSLRGVAAREDKAQIIDSVLQGGGPELLSKIPGKVKLPVIGNVSIGEALQIAGALKSMFQGGGLGQLTGGGGSVNTGSTGAGAMPP